jgi:hypothetical protein
VNVNYVDLAGNLWASRLTLKPTSPQTLSDWYVSQLEVTGEGRIPPYAQGALEHL